MIRNAVIHLAGKLPVLADLRAMPSPADQALLCTNVRTRDGKRPSFIDDQQAWFLIPVNEITIVELPADSLDPIEAASNDGRAAAAEDGPIRLGSGLDPLDVEPIEPDDDLLARIRQI